MGDESRVAETRWREHAGLQGQSYLEAYWATASDPQRREVLHACSTFGPYRSILDLGCHCGPFLALVQHPAFGLLDAAWGIEVSPEAAAFGNVRLGFGPARIIVASLLDLDALGLPQFDLVTATYALAYIAPRDLPSVLDSALRLARLGIVLAEPTSHVGQEAAVTPLEAPWGEWLHDYRGEFSSLGFQAEIRSLRAPKGRLNTLITVQKDGTA